MTDNFNLIYDYMKQEGIPLREREMGDLFFVVMLVRRGKDHPNLPAANYTFKQYYFDSLEKFNKLKKEMYKCCDIFGLRAYVSVNVKSKEQLSKFCALKYAENITNNEYKKPWMIFDHMFGKIPAKNTKTWIIDIDEIDLTKENDVIYLTTIMSIINSCNSKYETPIVRKIPTRSGIHILARPFNMIQYKNMWDSLSDDIKHCREYPEIKKNHITLLYENLDAYIDDTRD